MLIWCDVSFGVSSYFDVMCVYETVNIKIENNDDDANDES